MPGTDVSIPLAALVAALTLAPIQLQPEPATLSVRVERAFDDTEHSLERLRRLSDALPPMLHRVASGETLSGVIYARYGVSRGSPDRVSYLPRVYDWLQREIRRLSAPALADGLHPGDSLWIPTLPPRGRTDPGANPANRSPLRMGLPLLPPEPTDCKDWPGRARLGAPVLDSIRSARASQVASLHFPVPPGLEDCARAALMRVTFLDQPSLARNVAIVLDEKPPGPDGTAAAEREETAGYTVLPPFKINDRLERTLRHRLAAATGPPVDLYVLDTGWPSRAERDSSYAVVRSMLAWFDATYRLGADLSDSPATRPFESPTQNHVFGIREALAPFETLDSASGDRVRVVYVPLTVDQPGAEVLFRQLLYVARAYREARDLERALGQVTPLPAGDRARFRRDTEEILRTIAPTLADNRITTHSELVDAVRYLAGEYAYLRSGRPVVFNFSWTVRARSMALREIQGGLTVVAAGNDGKDILERERGLDFAPRSVSSDDDYLTVFVLDPETGVNRCASAHFRRAGDFQLELLYGVGFNGFVDRRGCYTSWATPRVAWLIAAKWAMTPHDPDGWGFGETTSRMRKTLQALRGGLEAKNFVLDPLEFLEALQ